jgi:hypothetical protein
LALPADDLLARHATDVTVGHPADAGTWRVADRVQAAMSLTRAAELAGWSISGRMPARWRPVLVALSASVPHSGR